MKNSKITKLQVMLVGILMNLLFIPYANSTTFENQSIPLTADWWKHIEGSEWESPTETRSLPSAPFTAYLENGNLFIQNNSGVYDLTISITNTQTGDKVYSQENNETAGTYIIISIADLPSGDYQLNISNPDSGHVYGYFNK